jgi:hypothetical protein
MNKEIQREQLALKAAYDLHQDLLTSDAAWGYSGSIEDFHRLAQECLAIVKEAFMPTVDTVLDAYWEVQTEVEQGERAVDWYL